MREDDLIDRRKFLAAGGAFAAALLAVSPFHIWHSQDAKMYTLVVLVTLGSTTLYLHALDKGQARWWACSGSPERAWR